MTPAKLRQYAERHGLSLEIERGGNTWQVILDAPAGRVLNSSSCHCDASLHGNGFEVGTVDWKETMRQLAAIIDQGTSPCEVDGCDICAAGGDV